MIHEGFLQAICEQPDDEAARLIYADWLDDAGDPARAEFIRLQCRRATLDADDPEQRALFVHETNLLAQHAPAWLAELPTLPGVKWGRRPVFERGFLASAEVGSLTALQKHLATLRKATPVRQIVLGKLQPDQARTLARWDGLSGLRGLTLRNSPACDSLVLELSACGHAPALQSLDMARAELREGDRNGCLSHEAIRAIATAPAFAHLRHLDLNNHPWTADTLLSLATHTNLNGLERLRLSGLWGALTSHLADGPGFPGLRQLCLAVRTLDPDAHLGPILRAPWAAGLRRLALPHVHHVLCKGRLVWTLLRAPHLSGLRCLDLTKTQLYATEEVARATNLTNLVFLRLGEGFISPAQLETLVNSTQYPELRELHLDWFTLEPAHIDVIARRTGLPKLELLVPVHARPATLRRFRERCPDLAITVGSAVPSAYA